GAGAVALLITMSHMGLLSALLTFAPRPWYAPYAALASASVQASAGGGPGMSGSAGALEDQQLAGVLMWVPSSVPYVAGVLVFTVLWLHALERRAPAGRHMP